MVQRNQSGCSGSGSIHIENGDFSNMIALCIEGVSAARTIFACHNQARPLPETLEQSFSLSLSEEFIRLAPFQRITGRSQLRVVRHGDPLPVHSVVAPTALKIFFQPPPHLQASVTADGDVTEIKQPVHGGPRLQTTFHFVIPAVAVGSDLGRGSFGRRRYGTARGW